MDISSQTVDDIRSGLVNIETLRSEAYTTTTAVDVITQPISYEEFFLKYLLPNRPCLLDTWATEGWSSRTDWVTVHMTPNYDHLAAAFGSEKVPVANCDVEEYSSHPKQDMLMSEYIDYMMLRQVTNKTEASGEPAESEEGTSTDTTTKSPCLYLKDWHFTRAFPDYEAYRVPVYFCSDWLNESWDLREDLCDDYRFVYIGPEHSWTPFHTDVFKSYSWSANIVGCKKWILFAPGEEVHYKDRLGNLAFDLDCADLEDEVQYPHRREGHTGLQVIQRSGQVLFVPSGWHHQVWNLEDTISINHNWYNGCNIDLCWQYIKSCLRDVQREIADCRDMEGWHQQCQLVLKASCGMDYMDFLQFLRLIGNNRIAKLNRTDTEANCETSKHPNNKGVPKCMDYLNAENISKHQKYYNAYNNSHALFDLNQIIKVMKDFVTIPEFNELDFSNCAFSPNDFLQMLLEECNNVP